jgi:hypothetical protein
MVGGWLGGQLGGQYGGQLGGQLGGRLGGCCPRFFSEGSDRAPPSPGCVGVFEWNTHSRPARIATTPSRCFVIQAARRGASYRAYANYSLHFSNKSTKVRAWCKNKNSEFNALRPPEAAASEAILVTKQYCRCDGLGALAATLYSRSYVLPDYGILLAVRTELHT